MNAAVEVKNGFRIYVIRSVVSTCITLLAFVFIVLFCFIPCMFKHPKELYIQTFLILLQWRHSAMACSRLVWWLSSAIRHADSVVYVANAVNVALDTTQVHPFPLYRVSFDVRDSLNNMVALPCFTRSDQSCRSFARKWCVDPSELC